MSLKITGNHAAIAARLRAAIPGLLADMRAAEASIATQARQLAELGAQINVYGTAPGRVYVRTNLYGGSMQAQPVGSGPVIGVSVSNPTPYASLIEYGTYGRTIPPATARQIAEGLGGAYQGVTLGRSGINYMTPAPSITRATVWAAFAIADAYSKSFLLRTA